MRTLLLLAALALLTGCATLVNKQDAEAAFANTHIGRPDPDSVQCFAAYVVFTDKVEALQVVGPVSALSAARLTRIWKTELRHDCAVVKMEAQMRARMLLRTLRLGLGF
jgi:hypothetical protein